MWSSLHLLIYHWAKLNILTFHNRVNDAINIPFSINHKTQILTKLYFVNVVIGLISPKYHTSEQSF